MTYVWGTSRWEWNRWYSRTRLTAFVSSQLARARSSLRQRRVLAPARGGPLRRPLPVLQRRKPRDSPAPAPHRAVDRPPRPEQRRRAALPAARAQAPPAGPARVRVRAGRRDAVDARAGAAAPDPPRRAHLLHQPDLPRAPRARLRSERTSAAWSCPTPCASTAFDPSLRPPGQPAEVIVLGRIATGKASRASSSRRQAPASPRGPGADPRGRRDERLVELHATARGAAAGERRIRRSRRVGQVPAELERSDILLQASKYEAFALTVAEALASGVPVVATTEVGAIENVDRSVAAAVAPGDVEAMAAAIEATLERLRRDPAAARGGPARRRSACSRPRSSARASPAR